MPEGGPHCPAAAGGEAMVSKLNGGSTIVSPAASPAHAKGGGGFFAAPGFPVGKYCQAWKAGDPSGGLMRTCILVILYVVLNSSFGIFNRWCLGVHGFRFPLLMTSANMIVGAVLMSPLTLCVPAYRAMIFSDLAKAGPGIACTI